MDDRLNGGWIEGCIDKGWMDDKWMDTWNGQMGGWMDGWMGEWMNGGIDERLLMDGSWMDG